MTYIRIYNIYITKRWKRTSTSRRKTRRTSNRQVIMLDRHLLISYFFFISLIRVYVLFLFIVSVAEARKITIATPASRSASIRGSSSFSDGPE